MEDTSGSLTVYYEGPFWVGVFERTEDGKLYVAKVFFGSEPSDKEILDQQRQLPQTTVQPKGRCKDKNQNKESQEKNQGSEERDLSKGAGTKVQEALKKTTR